MCLWMRVVGPSVYTIAVLHTLYMLAEHTCRRQQNIGAVAAVAAMETIRANGYQNKPHRRLNGFPRVSPYHENRIHSNNYASHSEHGILFFNALLIARSDRFSVLGLKCVHRKPLRNCIH